jgi:L-arabonate dehydrase
LKIVEDGMGDRRVRLRSSKWFAPDDLNGVIHRGWIRAEGFADSVFADGRPVIGILNTWSEVANCNAHLRELAGAVKRGVWRAGGFPLELPAMSLSEPLMKPTTMLYRNLLAMEAEESLRANPLDAAVLLSGCDKTTPGLLMAAASADIPAILLTGGPMLRGRRGTEDLAGGSAIWEASDRRRAGDYSDERWAELESCVARSAGHCGVMGTASTMAILAEAIGMSLPGAAAIPAVDSRRTAMAEVSGERIVQMALEGGPKPSQILTADAFRNAITTLNAVSGSTNAVIHLMALAGRAGIPLALDDFDRISRTTPWIVDVRPAGGHQMEELFYAGGVPAVLKEIASLLELGALTVTGGPLGAGLDAAEVLDRDIIRTVADPLTSDGGLAVLRGNLAPDGAVIKQSAMDPSLRRHVGPALVFRDKQDLMDRIDRPDLDVSPDSVLVQLMGGPVGAPGMPEWGQLPIPAKLWKAGVRDMVRISDARMSGTAYGACVLHVAPESAVGGPLALVRDGDLIELDVDERTLNVKVSDAELHARREAWRPPTPHFTRGYGRLYIEHVRQADSGADLDFLEGGPGVDWKPYEPTSH